MLDLSKTTTPTLDSREVAAMVEKRHDSLLRDIRGYIVDMDSIIAHKIVVNDFFHESSYQDSIGRTLPCYQITRKGCEFIANKLTGQKGTHFTAAYINHFHEMEKGYSEVAQLSPELQALKHLLDAMTKNELEQAEVKRQLAITTEKVDAAQTTIANIKEAIIERDEDWRKWINSMFNKAVVHTSHKDYKALRIETYDILEERAACDLGRRLTNLKSRLSEAGATKTRINGTTKLDVIEADVKLKEIYTSIVKEMSVRYVA